MDATNRPSQQLINAQKELARRRQMAGVSYRPPAAASVIREQSTVDSQRTTDNDLQFPTPSSAFRIPHSINPKSIRIAPTLAAFCLDRKHRHNGAALDGPYRLYKILQALDHNGRGWLANQDIEPLLTKKESQFYIYGRRQLKTILRRGEGLFWNRVKSQGHVRIRLVSRARLISILSPGSRLRGREVEIPLSYLLGSGRGRQADVNAALYAAVHAGRLHRDKGRSGETKPRPISRARLNELSGCSNYRQRSYERRMDITVQRNIHILGTHDDYDLERARRHFGLPAYKHTDHKGKINRHRRGAAYNAVRLPNSYHLPDAITIVNSRRLRTINRFLDGLCHLGSGGSDREAIVRLYHRDVVTAVRAAQKDQEAPAYWPMTGSGATRLWQSMQGAGGKGQDAECKIETECAYRNGRRDRQIPHSELRIPHSLNPKSAIAGGDLN